MKTNAQKYSEGVQATERAVRKRLGAKVICSECGATGASYINGTACQADLDDLCPGFERWDQERSAELDKQLAKRGLDIFGDPIK